MDDIKTRLFNCFATVFPDLPESQIPEATQSNVSSWDSIAAITLVNVLEDEFNIQLDLDKLADLDSFERIHDYLKEEVQVS
jgi:acyl carrier protein